MKTHGRMRVGFSIVATVVAIVAGHGIILYYRSSQLALSATAVSIVAVLVIVKHLGLLGAVSGLLRRHVSQSTALQDRREERAPGYLIRRA
jgi:membrane protein YdbS with pleckstrin-like domain